MIDRSDIRVNYMEALVLKPLSSNEVNTGIQVQILDEIIRISHSAYALGKGMYITILPPVIDKS